MHYRTYDDITVDSAMTRHQRACFALSAACFTAAAVALWHAL